jgi:hypothetical protein
VGQFILLQEVTLSGVLVSMALNRGLSFTPVEGPPLHQGIHLVRHWVIVMQGIWVSVIELLFHIEVIIPGPEIAVICFGRILIQRGAVFPCEVFVSIPFYFKLELPFAVGVLGPSRIHVLLHDIVLFRGFLLGSIPLLSDCDWVQD